MNTGYFGLDNLTLNSLILLLLLIILGIVTFHYYAYITTSNGLSFGTGVGVNILGKKQNK